MSKCIGSTGRWELTVGDLKSKEVTKDDDDDNNDDDDDDNVNNNSNNNV
jgi:hypothetical protein